MKRNYPFQRWNQNIVRKCKFAMRFLFRVKRHHLMFCAHGTKIPAKCANVQCVIYLFVRLCHPFFLPPPQKKKIANNPVLNISTAANHEATNDFIRPKQIFLRAAQIFFKPISDWTSIFPSNSLVDEWNRAEYDDATSSSSRQKSKFIFVNEGKKERQKEWQQREIRENEE